MTSDAPRLLACVYTCAAHAPLLPRFHASPVGRHLASRPGAQLIEVVASEQVPASILRDGVLTVRAAERYEALSLKTHAMLEFCVAHLEFDALLKIDVTTALDALEGPEYAGRSLIDPGVLQDFVSGADLGRDYNGLHLHLGATREGAEGWARKKGGEIDYPRLFGDGPMPAFYSGKCYLLSRRFARYVAAAGASMAAEHARYFLGAEDLMVGRLHERYRAAEAGVAGGAAP